MYLNIHLSRPNSVSSYIIFSVGIVVLKSCDGIWTVFLLLHGCRWRFGGFLGSSEITEARLSLVLVVRAKARGSANQAHTSLGSVFHSSSCTLMKCHEIHTQRPAPKLIFLISVD